MQLQFGTKITPSDPRCATHCPCWLGWTWIFDCRCSSSSSPSDFGLHVDNKRRLLWTLRGISLKVSRNPELLSASVASDSFAICPGNKNCLITNYCNSKCLCYLQHSFVFYMLTGWRFKEFTCFHMNLSTWGQRRTQITNSPLRKL